MHTAQATCIFYFWSVFRKSERAHLPMFRSSEEEKIAL